MATVTFQEITLAADNGDDQAVLVLRDGRLAAVLSRLGEMHDRERGYWYVEALFGGSPFRVKHTFATPDSFATWLEGASH
jgi:hypothetical protein